MLDPNGEFADVPSAELMREIQQIAFTMRLDNMAKQSAIDDRIRVLRARLEGTMSWDNTKIKLREFHD